ncbi:MAG TPA: hypothetical protein VEB23_04515 [Ramlibacter sp.]|nr:hypothetical protein [Ramlibacter sp.]
MNDDEIVHVQGRELALPERMRVRTGDEYNGYPQGWNDALEAVKEMNAALPAQGRELPPVTALQDLSPYAPPKPICWLRTCDGKPDWSEDCVGDRDVVMNGYEDEVGYDAIPLYAHPPKMPAIGVVPVPDCSCPDQGCHPAEMAGKFCRREGRAIPPKTPSMCNSEPWMAVEACLPPEQTHVLAVERQLHAHPVVAYYTTKGGRHLLQTAWIDSTAGNTST